MKQTYTPPNAGIRRVFLEESIAVMASARRVFGQITETDWPTTDITNATSGDMQAGDLWLDI
jgi:hypothetical protein